ncbi:MAG: glycine cleavage system protein GcvH [Rhodospirillales bacterium]|nr:glycine cleavage system protein GcvH [Rhodospirillales bacterium]
MTVLRFTNEHEWISFDEGTATVGITDFAAHQLGDIVFVELPEVGKTIAKAAQAAVVESVKAASEVYSPASGAVTEINQAIVDQPGNVNESPEGAGWFYKMSLSAPGELSGLMDKEAYDAYLKTLDH